MATLAQSAIPKDNKLFTPGTPRSESLMAVTGNSNSVEVASVYPTNATAYRPTPPVVEATAKSADFYRDGRYKSFADASRPAEFMINPRRYDGWEYDEKMASIRIYGALKGQSKENDLLPPYTKFFLENVQEGHAEKTQIVETFGKFYVYSFGERPPMYTFSGKLLSTKNADWASDFAYLYDQYFRSTRAVERKARVIITYGGKQVEGLITALSTSKQADNEGMVPFQLQMVVFDRKFLNFSNDFGFSTGDGKSLVRDEGFQKLLDQVTGGRTGLGTSDPKISQATKTARGVVQNTLPAQGPLKSSSFGAFGPGGTAGGGGFANA